MKPTGNTMLTVFSEKALNIIFAVYAGNEGTMMRH